MHNSIFFCIFANDKNKDTSILCFLLCEKVSIKVSNGTEVSSLSFSHKLPPRNL
nr:MAG TPA: hypothetical protein [Caudoviricetes sp.]